MAHKSASLLCVGESAASSRPGVLEAPRRLSPEAPGTADPRPSLRYTEDLELVAQNDDLEVFAVSGTDGEWGQRCDEAVQNSVHGLSGSVNVFPGQHPRSNIRPPQDSKDGSTSKPSPPEAEPAPPREGSWPGDARRQLFNRAE